MNSTNDLILKQQYRRQIDEYNRLINDMQLVKQKSEVIKNERTQGCSPSDKNSLYEQKDKSINYWLDLKNKSVADANVKYAKALDKTSVEAIEQKRSLNETKASLIKQSIDAEIQRLQIENSNLEQQQQ